MYSPTKIAVPIFQRDESLILKKAKDYIEKGADILELRIDALPNPEPRLVKSLIEEINFPIILTNRKKSEGGAFEGKEEERIAILQECCDLPDYIDIEFKTKEKYINSITELGVKTIVSFHDFKKTPPFKDLLAIANNERILGDIAKIAVMPKTIEDTFIVLALLSKCEDTIAISMGDLGSYTRILASKFSSPITFATGGNKTAPGQIDIDTMKALSNLNIVDHNYILNNCEIKYFNSI